MDTDEHRSRAAARFRAIDDACRRVGLIRSRGRAVTGPNGSMATVERLAPSKVEPHAVVGDHHALELLTHRRGD